MWKNARLAPLIAEPAPPPPPAPGRLALILDAAAWLLLAAAGFVTLAGRDLLLGIGRFRLPAAPSLLLVLAALLVIRHVALRGGTIADTMAWWRLRLGSHPHVAAAFYAFAATRPAVFFAAYFAVVTVGLAPTVKVILSPEPLANLPARFDAGWYGSIAVDGYKWDRKYEREQQNIAFFPALPMLMRPAGALLGANGRGLTHDRRLLRSLWAGVCISLVAFFVALVYVSKLSGLLAGPAAAASAPLLLAAYPFAVFFNAPYTEALFLLGAVGAFYHFHRGQWIPASLYGLLVGFSRPNGCLVAVPLAIIAVQQIYRARMAAGQDAPVSAMVRPLAVRLLVAAMPGFAMLMFSAYLYRLTQVWLAWARMQGAWGRRLGTAPMAQGWEWLTTEGLLAVSRGVPFDTLNTLAVLFVLALLWAVVRRVGVAYALFVALNLVPPLFAGGALSMGRITSTLFPVFIALGATLPRESVPAWVAAFAIGQGFVAALFFTGRELF